MKEIILSFADDGSYTIDLKNFHGKGCHSVMAQFTDGAGTVTHIEDKPEYNERTADVRQKDVVKR